MHVVKLAGDPRPDAGEDWPVVRALVLRHHPDGKFRVFDLIVNRDTPGFGVKNFSHVDTLSLLLTNSFGDEHPRPEPTSTIMFTFTAGLQ